MDSFRECSTVPARSSDMGRADGREDWSAQTRRERQRKMVCCVDLVS